MVVGMDNGVVTLHSTHYLNCPVGNDLVDIHVVRRPGPCLEHVHNEMFPQPSLQYLIAGLDYRHPLGLVQNPQRHIHPGSRLLYLDSGCYKGWLRPEAADGEVLHGPDCMDAVIGINRHLHDTK